MANDNRIERRRSVVRHLASLGVAMLLIVTTASAFIRLSRAGLGCGDWPACYGRLIAPEESARRAAAAESPAVSAARLLHRVTAVAVLVLVLTLAAACFSKPVLWREGWTALALIALAVFLAVLGRWTAGSLLPAIALGNLFGGFAMLAMLWWLRLRSGDAGAAPAAPGLRLWWRLALVVLTLQIALGALVSAGFAAASCTTLPECNGIWWPAPAPWQAFDPWWEPLPSVLEPGNPVAAVLHMAHRFGAALALTVLGGLAGRAWWAGVRAPAAALAALLAGQAALGAGSVLAGLPLAAVVAHNLTAASLLLALVSLGVRLHPATTLRPSPSGS